MNENIKFEFVLNILDIIAIIIAIVAIIVSVYVAYHISNLKTIESHLREIKENLKK